MPVSEARVQQKLAGEARCNHLRRSLKIDGEELLWWTEVSRKMFVPFHDDVLWFNPCS